MKYFNMMCIAFGLFLPLNRSNSSTDVNPLPRVIAYYPIWGADTGYTADKIPGLQLTHAIYSFIHVSSDGLCELLSDGDNGTDVAQAALDGFKNLKKTFPKLKTMVAIGGAGYSQYISGAAETAAGRKNMVSSCLEILKKYDFDGIDVDWEYPKASESANLVALLAEFRNQLPADSILSAAVVSDQSIATLDIAGMSTYLDWFGVMAYDRCGASASETCHHALYDPPASPTLTGHEAMQMYLDGGAKPGQLVLGIPFYGYKWTVDSSDMNSSHGIGETTTGSSRKAGGEIPYRDVKSKYLGHTGYQYYWDASAHESVIFNNDTSEVISFDDENSIALKAKVVRDSGLGGIMIWDITTDDDQGTLLGAVNRP